MRSWIVERLCGEPNTFLLIVLGCCLCLLQAEEARFRAQLQELEQQRMGVIEAAWRSREGQRQSDIAAMKAKYAALEKQTKELLTVTQERERVLLASEAELRLRKAGLEREAAVRMTEAEAAVRRLQVCVGCRADSGVWHCRPWHVVGHSCFFECVRFECHATHVSDDASQIMLGVLDVASQVSLACLNRTPRLPTYTCCSTTPIPTS